MKILVVSAASLAAFTVVAHAAISVGRGEISATVAAVATYDSNVFGQHVAVADWSGTLNPRLTYLRKAGQIEAEANAGISFIRFLDETQLDADNIALDASLRLPASDMRNFSGSASAAYVENSDVNADLNTRIVTKITTLSARGALITGARTDVALNSNYSDTRPSIGSDQEIFSIGSYFNYKDFFNGNTLRLAVDYDQVSTSGENSRGVPLEQNSYMFSAGLQRAFFNTALHGRVMYGYRVLHRSALETSAGITRHGGSVITATLDGPFLPEKYFPKVKSQFSLSYQDAATPGINDTGTKVLAGAMSLSWQARETTKVRFEAHRDQRLAVNDLSVVTTTVQLGLEQELRYNLSASLTVGHDWSTYRTIARRDRVAWGRAGLRYHFAGAWDAAVSYTVNSTESTQIQSTYDRNIASFSLTYRY